MMSEENLKFFSKEGYLFLENIFESSFIQNLKSEFDKNYINKLNSPRNLIHLEIQGEFNNSKLYAHPLITQILNRLLSPLFILESALAPTTKPGAEVQNIHSDGGILFSQKINMFLPPHAIGLIIPLVPINTENGGTEIWPKSHTLQYKPDQLPEDLESITFDMNLGDCLLLDTRICHRGLANNSQEVRPLLYLTYSHPWYINYIDFKKEDNLIMSDEEFQKVPQEFKRIFVRRNFSTSF